MTVAASYAWQQRVDVTAVLETISVPTLVVHRRGNTYHRVEFGRWIADRIRDATWVELDGGDSLPFHTGDFTEILDHVELFVTGERAQALVERRLATVLFTDIVGSTDRAATIGDERWLDVLSEVNRLSAQQVERFAGATIDTTGEITLHDDDIAGIGVHIASRVMSRAPDGRIGASRTVKDLTVGSAIQYEPLGTFQLKGVPGAWELFEVS